VPGQQAIRQIHAMGSRSDMGIHLPKFPLFKNVSDLPNESNDVPLILYGRFSLRNFCFQKGKAESGRNSARARFNLSWYQISL
jgi:hypothetical protein